MSRLEAALRRAETLNDEPAALPPTAKSLRVGQALAAIATPAPAAPPPVDGPSTLLLREGEAAEKLVVTDRLDQSTVEQYRKLAATLHHAQVERDLKVVLVSSAVSGDGKTLTATNLALTLSESYRRRVLLIDADLRRPSVHRVFHVKNAGGLTECLSADTDRRLPLVQATPYLSLLLAGPANSDPMSGLTSNRMGRLVGEAAATFDWVIIDTPPVVLLPDANLLTAMADAAILVIGAGKTPFKAITRAIDALGRNKIVGVVLNRAARQTAGSGNDYAYYAQGER